MALSLRIEPNGDSVHSTSIITNMVALPLLDSRSSSSNTAALAHTRTKLVPRKGVTDAWIDDLNDILAANRLSAVANEQSPPLMQDVTAKLPGVPLHLIEAIHNAITNQWWREATDLYYIIRASVDLSGIYEKKDLSMIKTSFLIGDYRHGPAFLRWSVSFTNMDSVSEQAKLISKVMSAKLPLNPTQEQFGQHIADLYIDWLAIKGNDQRNPASFYHTLLKSFPDVTSGNMWYLRSWLSDRISDNDSILSQPNEFIERFVDAFCKKDHSRFDSS